MPTQWFYKLRDKEAGPCSGAELKELARSNRIRPYTLVRKGTDGQWVAARRVKGLFDEVHPSANFPKPVKLPPLPEVVENRNAVPPQLPEVVEARKAASPPLPDSQPIEVVPLELVQPASVPVASSPTPKQSRRSYRWLGLALVPLLLVGSYPWFRNTGLREKLRACESYGVVEADVYYQGLASNIVVFNLKDGASSTARRIDPVHLFMQFVGKLDLDNVHRVVLARNGHRIFYISSTNLEPLSESYSGGGRIWAFNHLPENVRTMAGSQLYFEGIGGRLAIMQQQADNLNGLIDRWTGY